MLLFYISLGLILKYITLSFMVNYLGPAVFLCFTVFIIIKSIKILLWIEKKNLMFFLFLFLSLLIVLVFFFDSNLTNNDLLILTPKPVPDYKNIQPEQNLIDHISQKEQPWLGEINHKFWEWVRKNHIQTDFKFSTQNKISRFEALIDKKIQLENLKIQLENLKIQFEDSKIQIENLKSYWLQKPHSQITALQTAITGSFNVEIISVERQEISNDWGHHFVTDVWALNNVVNNLDRYHNTTLRLFAKEIFMFDILDNFLIGSERGPLELKNLSKEDLRFYNATLFQIKENLYFTENPRNFTENSIPFQNARLRFSMDNYIHNQYVHQKYFIAEAKQLLRIQEGILDPTMINTHLFFLEALDEIVLNENSVKNKINSLYDALSV